MFDNSLPMSTTHVLFEGYTAIRNKPVNYTDTDAPLFGKALTCEIAPVHLLRGKNIAVVRSLPFSLRKPGFLLSYSNILPVSLKMKLKALWLLLKPGQQLEKAIWITDEWSREYFHWITDALTRWLAVKEIAAGYPVLLPQELEYKTYISESLALLGIPVRYFNPRKKWRVKEMIMPGHTAPTGNYNHAVIRRLRPLFLKAAAVTTTTPHRKIYVSREKAAKRKAANEAAIVALMMEYGFEVHYFEDYSLQEQIALMAETRTLIGIHGAGLTNMLFMPEGGNIVELRNRGDGNNNCFFSLASDMGHRYYYLENQGSTSDTYNATLEVDPARLRQLLEMLPA